MKTTEHKTQKRGFGLIEMLIGAATLSVALLGISDFFQSTLNVSGRTQAAIQGDYLLEEGVEVLKLFRDEGYTTNLKNLPVGATHYFAWTGTNWATTTANVYIDGMFERGFTVANVNRDANDDIATVGTNDPNTKLVTVSVAWREKTGTTTRSISAYLMNIFNN